MNIVTKPKMSKTKTSRFEIEYQKALEKVGKEGNWIYFQRSTEPYNVLAVYTAVGNMLDQMEAILEKTESLTQKQNENQ